MDALKTVREVLGISQKDLARILGISLSLLKQVETGRRNLPMGVWNMLSSISAFVGKIDHQKKPEKTRCPACLRLMEGPELTDGANPVG